MCHCVFRAGYEGQTVRVKRYVKMPFSVRPRTLRGAGGSRPSAAKSPLRAPSAKALSIKHDTVSLKRSHTSAEMMNKAGQQKRERTLRGELNKNCMLHPKE